MADPEIIKGEADFSFIPFSFFFLLFFSKMEGRGGGCSREGSIVFIGSKGVGAPLDSMMDPSLLTTIFKLCLEPILISYFSFGGCIHLKFETLTQHMFMPLANYYFNQLNRPL